MPLLSIPENYYAVVDANTKVVLPAIITCMGICITAFDNRKVVAHYADLPGYPFRKPNRTIHPLPYNFLAMEEFSSEIFEFLLGELNVSATEIKEVSVFGYYRKRVDFFQTDDNVNVSDEVVRNFVSSRLNITPKQVQLNPLRFVNYGISPEGKISVLPDLEDLIEDIESDNINFYEQRKKTPFSRAVLLRNHRMFQTGPDKKYAKDDGTLYDFDKQQLTF
ncbi:hypothetical protein [Legionella shakespearei]|uniref:Uncharacterized protein n=1 Tax=Legionella shakespearei DSM 23087 TaxID=1122169 RepID=A0A0W0ZA43_9GAMM|nr:hypothetical protein [Legionella shakespearei]KTD65969.1 hypothetical protein Lsha_0176 [Legionella shakespearei DSM 23087]